MKSKRVERLDAINLLIRFIVETDKERHNPTLGTKKMNNSYQVNLSLLKMVFFISSTVTLKNESVQLIIIVGMVLVKVEQ